MRHTPGCAARPFAPRAARLARHTRCAAGGVHRTGHRVSIGVLAGCLLVAVCTPLVARRRTGRSRAAPSRARTIVRLLGTRDPAIIRSAASDRAYAIRIGLRRWWYRDRKWIGRLVAWTGRPLVIDGARFSADGAVISDELRARMLRGRYERAERHVVRAWLPPHRPVVELGGGLGVVSTIINKRLHHPERHVVVQANPSLIPLIRRHREMNSARFTIEHAAIAYSPTDRVRLDTGSAFIGGRVSDAGDRAQVDVPATTLRALIERYPVEQATLVCDIEGMEAEMIRREPDVLRRFFSTLLIEIHPELLGAGRCEAMVDALRRLGYAQVYRCRKVAVFTAR
jgi:FkbM family methyltransferase